MKRYLLFVVVALAACKKTSTAPASNPVDPTNPNTSKTKYYDLMYWRNDTLTGFDTKTGIEDTVYALTISGKNYIKYKGVQYALKIYVLNGEHFTDSAGFYYYDMLDLAGNFITDKDTINISAQLHTSRQYNTSTSKMDVWRQSIMLPHKPPFPETVPIYTGLNKY